MSSYFRFGKRLNNIFSEFSKRKINQIVYPKSFTPFSLYTANTISTSTTNMTDLSRYTIPNDVPICLLECKAAFQGLTAQEKKYAHFMANACNQGGLIVLLQTSPEAPAIFMLLQRLFSEETPQTLKEKVLKNNDITEDEFKSLLIYAAGFYSNMGNYKSFGDTKIVPAISKESFKAIVSASEAYQKFPTLIEELWNGCSPQMYSLDKREQELGLGDKGVSAYYSSNITEKDVEFVAAFMKETNLSPYNTRLFKSEDGKSFEIRLASALNSETNGGEEDKVFALLGSRSYEGCEINITRGDYAPFMQRCAEQLSQAKEFAANDTEKQMLKCYVKSFTTGSIDSHKDGSRFWIKNQSPIVENYIGFIESYRDPYGVRGEFEGFVSMVNKETSVKFGTLVENAESFLKLLPWPSSYEKDAFLKPDFTSLDILTFAGSGIPAGINIPNYDDIRQDEGFKNVSLGNVLQSHSTEAKVTFLTQADAELFTKYKSPALEVIVGLHELLGHGSGKLFYKNDDGTFNFDTEKVRHLETEEVITTWYLSNETWDTKFSSMASTYEECRAESVGLHLSLDRTIQKIFGFEGEVADNIIYICWLNMVRAGLLGLEFYSPDTSSWKQAHMNARYVILQVLLEAGNDFVVVKETTGEDGQPDLLLTLDRTKIETVGREAMANFLKHLQLYKATADVENGKKMYSNYSQVDARMLELRKVVLSRKQPRRMFVQCNTKINGEGADLVEYPADAFGLIESFTQRYPTHDDQLEQLWRKS